MALLILKFTIVFLFLNPILIDYGVLPNASAFLVEILSVVMMFFVILIFAINKKFFLDIKYFLLFMLVIVVVLIGAIIQNVGASAVIFGLRHYLLCLPFFLLPLVHDFNEAELKKILNLILICLLLQIPVAILQRFVLFSHLRTGDVVAGTIRHSGALSILLIFAIVIVYSCYLKKILSYKTFILLSVCLFAPTTINETKVTFLYIPFVLILPTLLQKDRNIFLKMRKVFSYSIFAIILLIVFALVYDKIYGEKSTPLVEYLQRESSGQGYLFHSDEKSVDEEKVGRIDAVLHAYRYLSQEQAKLFFGIGLGNVEHKKIKFLENEDIGIEKYVPYSTSLSNILWEFGITGLMLLLTFNLFLFFDTLKLKREEGLAGSLGLGWSCICFLMIPTYVYINTFYIDVVNVIFWFLSGMIVSYTMKFSMRQSRIDY